MRISRIYQNTPLQINDTIELDEWAIQHTVIALRLRPGFIIHLFNNQDAGEYQAELVVLGKKRYGAKILAFIPKDNESPLITHLGQCVSRSDRMDFALQKSVELGVTEITPLISEHCSVKLNDEQLANRLRHWQNILISAAEQSERCFIPKLNPPQSLLDFVINGKSETKILFHPDTNSSMKDLPTSAKSVSFIIGPEGGLSDREVALTQQYHFIAIKLGPRVVRTETATVMALSLLQGKWGDLG
jgi:16S rRNA (uracil1498-N3)-methyltransferase